MNKVDRETLHELYVIRGMPMHQVAKEMNIAVGSVYNYIHKYGISSRPIGSGMKGKTLSVEAREKISKAHKGKIVSEETKRKMSESTKAGGIGHKKERQDGYISVYFPDHPGSSADGYIMEHILVMEALLGRHLYEHECVHHINENKADNRKENLQLMTKSEHMSFHSKKRWEEKKKGGMTYQ